MIEEDAFIQIRLTGNGVNPESLKAREVAELLKNLEESLFYIVAAQNKGISKDDFFISPTEIKNESAGYGCIPNLKQLAIAGFMSISGAISSGQYTNVPIKSIDAIKEILKIAKKKQCDAEFKLNNEVKAVLTKDAIVEVPASAYIKGHTTIYAYIKRSGGADPTVQMQVNPKDGFIYVKTSEDIAKQLGVRLYETVGLIGFATWERATRKLIDFKIEQILPYKETSIANSFDVLREKVGKYWDNISDVENYLIRNED